MHTKRFDEIWITKCEVIVAKYYDQNICKRNVAMMPLTKLTISQLIRNIM